MKISIVLPFYNRKTVLPFVLRSLVNQTRQPDEIIIVDDGSRVPLHNWLHYLDGFEGEAIGFRREDKGYRNSSAPYNAGLRRATGDVVVLCAGELIHGRHNIELIEKHLTDNPNQLVIGSQVLFQQRNALLPSYVKNNPDWILDPHYIRALNVTLFQPNGYGQDDEISRHVDMQSGIHAVYRKHAEAINGYDEDLTSWGHNDGDFRHRLSLLGLSETRDNNIFSIHPWHGRPPQKNMKKSTEHRLKAQERGTIACKNGLKKI